jgi:transposase
MAALARSLWRPKQMPLIAARLEGIGGLIARLGRGSRWSAPHIALTPGAHFHSPAREFLQCRRANGDTKTESIRALKRRFSDVVYSALPTD